MTTFAHIGGGIAVAAAVQHFVFKEEIAPSTLIAGALLGLLPDLDSLFALLFGRWVPGTQMLSHHRYFSHTPLFYIFVSGIVGLVFGWKWAAIFIAVTYSHLLMDSWGTDDGIMWLWPLQTRQFSLFPMDVHAGGIYGLAFYFRYFKTPQLIWPEIFFMAAGIWTIIRLMVQRNFPEAIFK